VNFDKLSDADIEIQIGEAVRSESKAQTLVLHLLAEVERRRIYSKEHPSLFEYCVKTLKYSNGAAQRRIDTMRAMKVMPEIENKIISGELNLTSVSRAQSFLRHEAKKEKAYSLKDKKELLEKLENKSTRECIETLVAISPESVRYDKRREVTPEKTELRVTLDKNLIEKLDRLKSLMSHKNPGMTDSELISEMADLALQKLDPMKKVARQKSLPAPEVPTDQDIPTSGVATGRHIPAQEVPTSRYIPSHLRKAVWDRDQGRCTRPGCGTQFFLEIDHIKPIAQGGKTVLSNLRLLCKAHNQRAAVEAFGFDHMNQFLNPSACLNTE
jgi:hypothetical protein